MVTAASWVMFMAGRFQGCSKGEWVAGTHCASQFKNHRLSTSARTRTVTTRNHNLHSGGGSPRRFGPVRQMYPMHQHAFVREAGPLCPPLTCSSHVLPIAWKVPGNCLEIACQWATRNRTPVLQGGRHLDPTVAHRL